MSDIRYGVERLIKQGYSEDQAVEAIKRVQAETKRDPTMFAQPYIYEDGKKKDNPIFRKKYGDPEKIIADTQKNVGSRDYAQKLAMDEEIEDRKNHRLGIKKTVGTWTKGY